MQLGMIGLGRMGANMVRRLMRAGHSCAVYDRAPEAVDALVEEGATGARSLAELVKAMDTPRVICLMVPAAFVDGSLDELVPLLEKGDTGKYSTSSGGGGGDADRVMDSITGVIEDICHDINISIDYFENQYDKKVEARARTRPTPCRIVRSRGNRCATTAASASEQGPGKTPA